MNRIQKVVVAMEHFQPATRYIRKSLASFMDVNVVAVPPDQVQIEIEDAQILIPYMTKIEEDWILNKSPHLRLIQQFGAGLEGVPIKAATSRGVLVANVPSKGSGNDISTAEHAMCLLLACLRRLPESTNSFKQKTLGSPLGKTLHGQRVLVAGYGNIGKHLVKLLKPFGCHITCIRKGPWLIANNENNCLPDKLVSTSGQDTATVLNTCAKAADVLFLCLPLNSETTSIASTSTFKRETGDQGLICVNVGRGGLVDLVALEKALACGEVSAAGLDVFPYEPFDPLHPLISYKNVIATGHIGGHTEFSLNQIGDKVISNIIAAFNYNMNQIENSVNFPCHSESNPWWSKKWHV